MSFKNQPAWQDRAAVDDAFDAQNLNCAARGCPNRWSVDYGEGKVCSAHGWQDKHNWPAITQEQQRIVTDIVMARSKPKPKPPTVSRDEAMAKLRSFSIGHKGKAWAHELEDREMAGEVLTKAQRDMWRAALNRAPESDCNRE